MADPVSIAGSGVGVISLGLTVFSGLLQYYGDWKDSETDIAATYTSIEGLTKSFILIKDTIDGQSFRRDIVDRVTESLDSCSAGVQNLEKKLAKIRRATPDKPGEKFLAHARKATYPFKKSTLIKLAEVVSDLRDNVSLAVDTLQLDVSASSLQKLEDISAQLANHVKQSQSASADIARDIAEVRLTQKEHDSRLLDQETLQIIGWLSPLNFSIRQNDVLSRRQQGAGNWLVQSDHFQMWLDGKISVLWCPGMPGAGKTVLASVIVDYLKQKAEQDGVGIGYVYCIYNAIDQTAINLMASLLQQLVQQQSVLSEDIKSLYKRHCRERTRPSLPECIRLLQAHTQRFPRVYIVVDALDECSEDDSVRDLFLAQLRYLLPNICLLVTSRYIPSLDQAFDDATRLEIRADDHDLRTYLEVRIEEQALLRSHIKDDTSLRDTIINTIIDKANGMFLLAKLHLDSLVNQDSRTRLRSALQSLPKEIDKTYDETMLRIDSQERQKVDRAGQVLSWVSLAERPLTVRELQYALAIEPEDTEFDEEAVPNEAALLSVCCGLVVVEQQSNIVRFVHFTTEKYIEQIRRTRYPSAQKLLSGACLTYLSLKVFASGPGRDEDLKIELRDMRTWLQVNPLLGYAAQHWGDHARKAFEQGLNMEDMILVFLRARGSVESSVQVGNFLDHISGQGLRRSYGLHCDAYNSDLHILAGFGLDKLARKVIDQGTDVNVRDNYEWTPLHQAAAKGHAATVRMLLDQGANTRAKDRSHSTALEYAASAGYERVVQTLVEVELEVPTTFFRWSSTIYDFFDAVRHGHVKVIQVLLKHLKYDERSAIIMRKLSNSAVRSRSERVVDLELEEGEGLEGFDVLKGQALGGAAANNSTSVMGLLLEAGADINAVCSVRNPFRNPRKTALQIAAGCGHVAATELLLDKGANLEVVSDHGNRPLHMAARRGHDKIISLLLEKGASVDAPGRKGETALISAAKTGLVHVVRQLLDRGADITVKDQRCGWSALHWAIVEGHETVVELFLEHETPELTDNIITLTRLYHAIHADDNTGVQELLSDKQMLESKDIREFLSLHAAVKHRHGSVVKAFLKYGAEVSAKDKHSKTALMRAAARGYTPVVKLLLEHGADIECKDDRGQTALSLAARNGHTVVVKLLLERGVDIESKVYVSQPALSLAARNGHTAVVKLLLENGADIEAKDDESLTALILAAASGHTPVVKLLLENGADIEAKDDESLTALILAATSGHTPVVKLLLESKANIESSGRYWTIGTAALIGAARTRHVETVQLLLQAGANTNGRGPWYGQEVTAIHQATRCGSGEVLKLLTESGADLEARNSKGETVLVIAVRAGKTAKSQLLLERGANPNAVEATVTPSDGYVDGVHFQTALELVQEAKKTWKGNEPGSDTVKGHPPGKLMHILYGFREWAWRGSIASITRLPFSALRSHCYHSVFRPLVWANISMAVIGLLLVSFLYLYISLSQ